MVSRVAFTVFGKPIYWYGIVIAAAVLLGVCTATLREEKMGLRKDTALDFALVAMPVAIVCARMYYVAFSWDDFAGDWRAIVDIRSGGLAIYGGMIGGALAGWGVARAKGISFGKLADLVAPSLALGQAIGRWGNFFNQEAYGRLAEKWLFFPAAVYIEKLQEWHLATFFYESLWCFLLYAFLEAAVHGGFFAGRKKGEVFLWYAFLYSAERTVVEGLRTDSLYFGAVRISQALSAGALAVIGLVFFLRAWQAGKKAALLPFVLAQGASLAALLGSLGLLPMESMGMLLVCVLAAAEIAHTGLMIPNDPDGPVLPDK